MHNIPHRGKKLTSGHAPVFLCLALLLAVGLHAGCRGKESPVKHEPAVTERATESAEPGAEQEEPLAPIAKLGLADEYMRPGLYPERLHGRSARWTIVGLPADTENSLLDEYGNLEPTTDSCVLMPYVYLHGRIRSALDAPILKHTDDPARPLPSVSWQFDDLHVDVTALTWGAPGDSVTFARYRVANPSDKPAQGRLMLAVRPFHLDAFDPPNGWSPIRSLGFVEDMNRMTVLVNGRTAFVALDRPDEAGARPFEQGDVVADLVHGQIPAARVLESAGGRLSGVMAFDFSLAPEETRTVIVAAPLHRDTRGIESFVRQGDGAPMPSSVAFAVRLEEMRDYWTRQRGSFTFDLPDRAPADRLSAALDYVLLNRRGVAILSGPRGDMRSGIQDGAAACAALLRMGLDAPAREYLAWYAARVQPDGRVPLHLNSDGTIGEEDPHTGGDAERSFIGACLDYYRFTKDRAFIEKHLGVLDRAYGRFVALRENMTDPASDPDGHSYPPSIGMLIDTPSAAEAFFSFDPDMLSAGAALSQADTRFHNHLTTRAASDFIVSARNRLVCETDGKLHLLRGVRESRLLAGDGIRIGNLPTVYGVMQLAARADAHTMRVELRGDYDVPQGMELHWPAQRGKPARVTIQGHEWPRYDDKVCHISGKVQGVLIAEWPRE